MQYITIQYIKIQPILVSPPHLLPPMASISSIKIMHGVFAFAASNKSLTLFAPTPTYISSNSV